jgi:hypothetical protein
MPSQNTEDSLKPIGKDETLHLVSQSSIYSIQNMVKDMYAAWPASLLSIF